MCYGVIAAMESEIDELLKIISEPRTIKVSDTDFIEGTINDQKVVIVYSGIGKVNAAITTTLLLVNFEIDKLIHLGVAGGLDENQKQGDVVIAKQVAHSDADATLFGYEYGQVPEMDKYYESSQELIDKLADVNLTTGVEIQYGTILTQDTFMETNEQKDKIISHFINPLAIDMESAAIAQAATRLKIPFIIIRSISDVVGAGNSKESYETFLKLAVKNSTTMVNHILR